AAQVYGNRLAVVHGAVRRTWAQTYERAQRLAGALAAAGIQRGDTVAVMLPNIPAMIEAHFGVPMAGAVLNALNTRLDARTLAFILEHGSATVLLYDSEYAALVREVLGHLRAPPRTVRIEDSEYAGPHGDLGDAEYEAWLAANRPTPPGKGRRTNGTTCA
ncbi:AMP-binding protein, partial [Piscirickettsia salmonis]|uniref:AMP-binding protein n=1 Tax=Piscirickettsia salmonis TaxID=1238 RepID=UPI001C54CA2A